MGVPTFYRWLCNRYPRVPKDLVDKYNERNVDLSDSDSIGLDLLCPNPNGEFDNLYLDMNGIIHPSCHPENMEQPETEEIMFKCILEYIDRIFYLVRPRKLIYLAIDGVAPRAKINQQRSRRFKSAALADLEDETYEKLLKEYLEKRNDMEIPVRKNKWDSNVITPGTEFMYKLSKKIVEYIKDRVERYDAWKRIVVIFSDSNVPGEGEHKIMEFIRSQRHCPDYDPNTKHVLHGMDADLIMLGLATHEPNFYILREIVTFFVHPSNKTTVNELDDNQNGDVSRMVVSVDNLSKVEKYMKMMRDNWKPLQLLQLSVLREYLSHQLRFASGFDNGNRIDFERCIDDLVLMIFFCGNDFLPNLPSISITGGSIDQMVLLYQKLLPSLNDYLSNEGNLNFHSISTFFHYLSKIENETFKQIHEYKQKSKEYYKNKQQSLKNANSGGNNRERTDDGSASSEAGLQGTGSEVENNRKSKKEEVEKEFMEKYEEELNKLKAIEDVKLSVDVTLNDPTLWKEAYYKEKFRLTEEHDLQEFVREVSYNYIKGICWVLQYYYQGCPSWSWYYPYHYSPFCSDLEFSSLYINEEDSDEIISNIHKASELNAVRGDNNDKGDGGGRNNIDKVGRSSGDTVNKLEVGGEANVYKDEENPNKQPQVSSESGDDHKRGEKRKKDDMALIKFDYGKPLTPFQQLMGVMPIRSSHCIPKRLRVLMTDPDSPLRHFYPVKFEEDPNGKRYKYQWVALLPFIDEETLLSHVKPIEDQLSEHEKYRNRVSQNIIFLTGQNRKTFINQINQILDPDSNGIYSDESSTAGSNDDGTTTVSDVTGNDDINNKNKSNKDRMEYYVCKCNKKHRSALLNGAKIPPKILTVQDIMEEQRNRGFNCEAAKRMILNMLSSNNRDPYGTNQSETILRDTARDYHQYHNQYNPGQCSGSYTNPYHNYYANHHNTNAYANQYASINYQNQYQHQSGNYANQYHTGRYQPSKHQSQYQNEYRSGSHQNRHHKNQVDPYHSINYGRNDQNYGKSQYYQGPVNHGHANQHTQSHHHNKPYQQNTQPHGNNNRYDYRPQHQIGNNPNTHPYTRRSSNEKYY